MTRINTNIPSISAQVHLARSQKDLNTTLTRLSSGLRINRGADDPAGLIASESLRAAPTSSRLIRLSTVLLVSPMRPRLPVCIYLMVICLMLPVRWRLRLSRVLIYTVQRWVIRITWR